MCFHYCYCKIRTACLLSYARESFGHSHRCLLFEPLFGDLASFQAELFPVGNCHFRCDITAAVGFLLLWKIPRFKKELKGRSIRQCAGARDSWNQLQRGIRCVSAVARQGKVNLLMKWAFKDKLQSQERKYDAAAFKNSSSSCFQDFY